MKKNYQRLSGRRNIFQRIWECLPGFWSDVMGLVVLVAGLGLLTWWMVYGAIGGELGEEHYKRLYERTHPDSIKKPTSQMTYEKVVTEYRYHDHNNLSTKNRSNATDNSRKKMVFNKKSYTERPPEVLQKMCTQLEENMRFDCFPRGVANEADCVKRGCCWRSTNTDGVPFCYYPPQYDTFRFVNQTRSRRGLAVHYAAARASGYPGDFALAKFEYNYLSDDVLQIKITDANNKRFEPSYPEIWMVPKPLTNMKYRVEVDETLIGFKVIRTADNVTIVNTQDVGGLVLSERLLQLSAVLPRADLYGLGERRAALRSDTRWHTLTLFNRDRAPVEQANLYGTQPFYLAVEDDGKSHGMLLLNSNAMDIVLQPTPGITYRAVGGVLNLFVFLGAAPHDVLAQYTELVGRPFMPPYWALGFHLCKFNYGDLNVTKQVWQSNRDAGIPFDVQWNDIDYMENHNDFTYDKQKFAGLPEFVEQLHNEGMHYMIIIDPGVGASEKPGTYPPYDRGLEMDVFVKNSTNQPFVGQVWNKGYTVFPDFTHPNSTPYWLEMMSEFHKIVPYDGAWIDMNEPSNFADGSVYGRCAREDLPYMPHTRDDVLSRHTLCMEAQHYAGAHYDLHSTYCMAEADATHYALQEIRGKRPFIISRANYIGMGQYAGHWSGDISSDWHDMRMSIPEMLSYSLFGIPMMGADICGFNGNTTPELCERWMQLGAFYPFARNHNTDGAIPQDPASLGPRVVSSSRAALRTRYALLPYYYTLFWRAHVHGETVVRPLFFEALQDPVARGIDGQFLVGALVLVSPALSAAPATRAYFPAHAWYSLRTARYIARAAWRDVQHNDSVAVRGGAILPLQEPPARGPVSTANTRAAPLQLLAVPAHDRRARGELYWDDGDSIHSYEEGKYTYIEFHYNNTEFRSEIKWWAYGVPSVNMVIFYNQPPVKTVSVYGKPCSATTECKYTYFSEPKILEITKTLPLDKEILITWTYENQGANP